MINTLKYTMLALVVAAASLLFSNAKAADHAYIGSRKCRPCHIKEYRSWSETKMAKAFDILKPGQRKEIKLEHGLDPNKDYTQDATCLACHTTGYGKPGGFKDIEATPDLVGVGCEMCHGPGGTYVQDQYMSLKNKNYKKSELVAVGLIGEITASTCIDTCHNPDNPTAADPYEFKFEERKDEGIHTIYPLKYKHE
jgi:hypothetical protein